MSSQHFRRDRLTLYAYCNLAAYVWVLYGMGPALLIVRDETGMSRTLSSLHSTALAAGVILAGIIGGRVIERLRRSGSMQVGTLFTAVGTLGFAFGATPEVSLPSALILGFAGSVTINAQNAFFAVHHKQAASAAIGESNGIAVAAGLISPLVLGGTVALGWSWRLAMMIPVAVLAIGVGFRGSHGAALDAQAEEHHTHVQRLPRLYWWAWVTMLLCVATEFAFVLWAGDVLREQAGVSTAVAAAGLSAVAVGMMLGRFAIPALIQRWNLDRVLAVSLLVPIIAWVPMWLSTSGAMILAAMFIVGLGLGFHFPIGMSRMLVTAPGLADEAATRSSLASGIAIGVSPFALALLANAVGLHSAFIMVPVLLAGALLSAVTHPVR